MSVPPFLIPTTSQKYAQNKRTTITQVLVNLILEFCQKEDEDTLCTECPLNSN